MNPTLREDIATIATTFLAVLIAAGAITGAALCGVLQTLAYGGLGAGVYLAAWGMLRLTLRPLRRTATPTPAPAPAPASDND